MARKTREEAAETREALLDAAEQVFRAKGVAHATLADVAHAAGLTRGAVYWHFRDKAALFEAMCDRATLPMETMFDARRPAADVEDPLGVLRDNGVRVLLHLASDARMQAVFDVVFHKCEFTDDLAAVSERHQQEDDTCQQQVIALLERAVVVGDLPADTDTALAADAMKAFMLGIMHEWVREPDAARLAATAPAMMAMFIAGLKAAPPRRAPLVAAAKPRAARVAGGTHAGAD
ncbi:MAG: TetR family transcriptional regulator [Proteobacteria bacterium]|nr:TetR family transcriptional regulator [Pseudomonadota bacterium]